MCLVPQVLTAEKEEADYTEALRRRERARSRPSSAKKRPADEDRDEEEQQEQGGREQKRPVSGRSRGTKEVMMMPVSPREAKQLGGPGKGRGKDVETVAASKGGRRRSGPVPPVSLPVEASPVSPRKKNQWGGGGLGKTVNFLHTVMGLEGEEQHELQGGKEEEDKQLAEPPLPKVSLAAGTWLQPGGGGRAKEDGDELRSPGLNAGRCCCVVVDVGRGNVTVARAGGHGPVRPSAGGAAPPRRQRRLLPGRHEGGSAATEREA